MLALPHVCIFNSTTTVRKKLIPKRRVFSVYFCCDDGKVLEEGYEDSDIQPLSKTVILHEHNSLNIYQLEQNF
jgi:hypothetical protein